MTGTQTQLNDLLDAPIPERVDGILDERGRLCPLPIVHLATWLRSAEVGAIVYLTADDPGFLSDLVRWHRVRPVSIVALRQQGPTVQVWLRNERD